MGPAALRRTCLGHTGAQETFPFRPGVSVFKVEGKVFAMTRLKAKPLTVTLKCEPEIAERLRAAHPEIVPGYHTDKRHWNTVSLDGGLTDVMVRDMLEDSYDLVVAKLPRRTRERLRWKGLAALTLT